MRYEIRPPSTTERTKFGHSAPKSSCSFIEARLTVGRNALHAGWPRHVVQEYVRNGSLTSALQSRPRAARVRFLAGTRRAFVGCKRLLGCALLINGYRSGCISESTAKSMSRSGQYK